MLQTARTGRIGVSCVWRRTRRRRAGAGARSGRSAAAEIVMPLSRRTCASAAREVERRIRHGHVARPRPVPPDGPGGHDRVAARLAADADVRAALRRDDLRDEVQERRAERVEAEDARARRAARRRRRGRERRCRCTRAPRRAPGTSAAPARRGQSGCDLHVVEERHVEEEPVLHVAAGPSSTSDSRPGPEDGERVVVVPAPGEPGSPPPTTTRWPGQDAVDADLGVAVEARPEPVVGPEPVERGGRREELRRGREDERPVRVDGDERAAASPTPRDDDARLRATHGRVLRRARGGAARASRAPRGRLLLRGVAPGTRRSAPASATRHAIRPARERSMSEF